MTIALRDVLKKFGEQVVVSKVSLEVQEGELFVLLGSSGSGKSTVLRLIAGLMNPDNGSILLRGKDVTGVPAQKREIGFVFQNYALFRHMTIGQNVEFGLRIRGMPARERKERRDELLDMVGLTGLANRFPNQLSGGQRQRVALARALAYRPSVLLLDEPFGALDVKIRSRLRQNLKALQRRLKITMIIVTHDQEEAFELADRIGVIERGRLVEIGTPHELYHTPRTEFVANFVGGGNVLFGRSYGGYMRLGKSLIALPPNTPSHAEGAPVRVLFRPEWVTTSREPMGSESSDPVLGQGQVLDTIFAGPIAKVRFELAELRGTQSVGFSLDYGQHGALIEAVHSSLEQDSPRAGETHWLSLRRYHVLQPSSLRVLARVEIHSKEDHSMQIATTVAGLSHGSLALLAVVRSQEQRAGATEKLERAVTDVRASRRDAKVSTSLRIGDPVLETVLEAQEGYFDMVILSRGSGEEVGTDLFSDSARHMLASARIPVLLAGDAPSDLKKILICTAAGEPGKSDVRFAARLARHTGASARVLHIQTRQTDEAERSRISRHLNHAIAVLNSFGIESDAISEEGPVVECIVRHIEQGYDLIVLGASRQLALLSRDRSTINAEILARTRTPVLIVPAQD